MSGLRSTRWVMLGAVATWAATGVGARMERTGCEAAALTATGAGVGFNATVAGALATAVVA